MDKPNRFVLYLGFLLIFTMFVTGIWSLFIGSKFWTIILVLLAILLAVSGITCLIIAYKGKGD